MKNLLKRTHFALYILLTCVLCVGCNQEKNKTKKDMEVNKNTAIGMSYTDSATTGCKSGEFGYQLEEYQLQFIKKCKKEGKTGCSLTINNQQIYVSFYYNDSVGNAR